MTACSRSSRIILQNISGNRFWWNGLDGHLESPEEWQHSTLFSTAEEVEGEKLPLHHRDNRSGICRGICCEVFIVFGDDSDCCNLAKIDESSQEI